MPQEMGDCGLTRCLGKWEGKGISSETLIVFAHPLHINQNYHRAQGFQLLCTHPFIPFNVCGSLRPPNPSWFWEPSWPALGWASRLLLSQHPVPCWKRQQATLGKSPESDFSLCHSTLGTNIIFLSFLSLLLTHTHTHFNWMTPFRSSVDHL